MNTKLLNILLLFTIIFGQVEPIVASAAQVSAKSTQDTTKADSEKAKKEAQKKADQKTILDVLGFGKEDKKETKASTKSTSSKATAKAIPQRKVENLDDLRNASVFNLVTNKNIKPVFSGTKYKPYNSGSVNGNYTIAQGAKIKPGELVIDFPKMLTSRFTGKKFDLKVIFIMNTSSPAQIDLGVNTGSGLTIGYKVANVNTSIPLRAEYEIYDSDTGKQITSAASMFVVDNLGADYTTSLNADAADAIVTTNKTTTKLLKTITVDGKPLEFYYGTTAKDTSDNGSLVAVNTTPGKNSLPILAVKNGRYLGDMKYTAYFSVGGTLSVTDVDKVTKEPIEGAKYELLLDGEVKDTYTTDSSGGFNMYLDAGDYVLRQVSVPDGYILDSTPHKVSITANEMTNVDLTTNHEGEKVIIHNVDDQSPVSNISGNKFKVVDSQNKTVASDITTGTDGKVETDWLPRGKYKLVQTDYDDKKYLKSDDIEFEIKTDSTGVKETLKPINKVSGSLTLKLVDSYDNTKGLANGIFALTKDGVNLDSIATDANGTVTTYVEPGTYQLKQLASPTNYIKDSATYTVVINKSKETTKTIINEPVLGKLKLHGRDENNQYMANMTYKVTGPYDYSEVFTGTSGSSKNISDLVPGEYTIRVLSAPDKYTISAENQEIKKTIEPGGDVDAYFDFKKFDNTKDPILVAQDTEVNVNNVPTTDKQLIELIKAKAMDVNGKDLSGDIKVENDSKLLGTSETGDYTITVSVKGSNGKVTMRTVKIKVVSNTAKPKKLDLTLATPVYVEINSGETAQKITDNLVKPKVTETINGTKGEAYSITAIKDTNFVSNTAGIYFIEYDVVGKQTGLHATAFAKVVMTDDPKVSVTYNGTEYKRETPEVNIGKNEPFTYNLKGAQVAKATGTKKIVINIPEGVSTSDISVKVEGRAKGVGSFQPSQAFKAEFDETTREYTIVLNASTIISMEYNIALSLTTEKDFLKGQIATITSTFEGNELTPFDLIADSELINFTPNAKQQILIGDEVFDTSGKMDAGESFTYQVYDILMPKSSKQQDVKATLINLGNLSTDGIITVDYKNDSTSGEYVPAPTADYTVMHTDGVSTVTIKTASTPMNTTYRINVPYITKGSFYGGVSTTFLSILEHHYEDIDTTQDLPKLTLNSKDTPPDFLIEADSDLKVENAWVHGYNYSFVQLKGSKEVYATGANEYGKLGTGDMLVKTEYTPTKYDPPLDDEEYVVDLQMGFNGTLVLTNTGEVYYAGNNDYGQRGSLASDTSTAVNYKFKKVSTKETITEIAMNSKSNYMLGESGTLYGTGTNTDYAISDASEYISYDDHVIATNVQDLSAVASGGTFWERSTMFYKKGDKWYARGYDLYGRTGTSVVSTMSYAQVKDKEVIKPDGKEIKEIYPYTTGIIIRTADDMLYAQGSETVNGGHPGGLDKEGQVGLTKVKFWRDNAQGQTVDVTENDLTVKEVHASWLGTLVQLSDGTYWYSGENDYYSTDTGSTIGTGIYDPYTFMQLDNLENTGLKSYRSRLESKGKNITFPDGIKKYQAGWADGLYIDNNDVLRVVAYDYYAFGSAKRLSMSATALRQWNTIRGIIQINPNKAMNLSNDTNSNVEGTSEGKESDLPNKVTISNPYFIDKSLSPKTTDQYWPYAHIDIKDASGKVINSTDIAVQEKKAINYTIPTGLLSLNQDYTVTTYFHTKNISNTSDKYRRSNVLSKKFRVDKQGSAKAYIHYYGKDYYDEATIHSGEFFTYGIEKIEYKKDTNMEINYTFPSDIEARYGDIWTNTKVYRRPLGTNDEFTEDEGAARSCDADRKCTVKLQDWIGADYEYKIEAKAYANYTQPPGARTPITADVKTGTSAAEDINTVYIVRDPEIRDPDEPYPYFMYEERRYTPDLEVEAGKSFIYNIDNINIDNTKNTEGGNLVIPIPKYLELDTSVMELYKRPIGSTEAYTREWWPAPYVLDGNVIVPLGYGSSANEYRVRLKIKASDDFPDATKTYIKPYIKYDDTSRTDKIIQQSIVYTEGANLGEDTTIESTDAKAHTTRDLTGADKYTIRMGTYPGEGVKYVSEDINVPDVSDLTGIEFMLQMSDNTDLATFANKMTLNSIKVEKTTDNGATYTTVDKANIDVTYPKSTQINVAINDTYAAGSSYRVTFDGKMLMTELNTEGINLTGFVKYKQGVQTTPFELEPINIYGLKPFSLGIETVMGNDDVGVKTSTALAGITSVEYQYRITNCNTCGDFSTKKPVTGNKMNIPITDINNITGRDDNKFNDYENIELKLYVNGRSLGTTTVRRWYPANVTGTVSQINDKVNPVAQITTFDLGLNNFGSVEHHYGLETYTRKALTTQTIRDGKINVDNALTVSTAVSTSREVPSTWNGINKDDLVNVDLSAVYQPSARFKLLLPSEFLDETLEEETKTIDKMEYKSVNFDLTNYLTSTPKLKVTDQYVIEKFSGRVYNKEYGELYKETADPYDIADGSNDLHDQDLVISDTLSNQFLVNPDQRDLHVSGDIYYEYIDYGLNKVNWQVSRNVTNEKEMFGFYKRDAKYYFINTKAADDVRACLIDNECEEVDSQKTLYEGRVKKGSLIKQQIRSDHSKLNSYKGVNEWIDTYMN